jgi:hypothetical protein
LYQQKVNCALQIAIYENKKARPDFIFNETFHSYFIFNHFKGLLIVAHCQELSQQTNIPADSQDFIFPLSKIMYMPNMASTSISKKAHLRVRNFKVLQPVRASTIRSNQQAIRIKVVYLCLVGGERRGERRRVGSHTRVSSSTCS